MPTELVLLSDIAPTADAIVRVAAGAHPDGTYLDYGDGCIRQVVDARGRALIQVYRSRRVLDETLAARAVTDPPATFALWTDMTIPFGDDTEGRRLAHAIATAVGGTVQDRI